MVVFNNVIHSIRHLAFQVSIKLLLCRLSASCLSALLPVHGLDEEVMSTSWMLCAISLNLCNK